MLDDEYQEFLSDMRACVSEADDTFDAAVFSAYAVLASENGDCPDLEPFEVIYDGRGKYRIDGFLAVNKLYYVWMSKGGGKQ